MNIKRTTISSLIAIITAIPVTGQEKQLANLPKYLTPMPYAGERNWHVTQNLGPTGIRGWIYGHKSNTNESREILVKSIEPGSPAEGILQAYDVIIGAAIPPETPAVTWETEPKVKKFDSDARLGFARALTWAESNAGKGQLKILRSRNGKTKSVVINLPIMGDYADSIPFECPKSQKIVQTAAEYLAKHMPADGYSPGVGRPHGAGLLLASHDPKYLDHVRRSAMRMALLHTVNDEGHETWRWGNTNTFLCEYYLATGDERVLPQIRQYVQVLQDGQSNPGTWGHRAVPDFIPPGYGSVNSTGVICFLSLVLAKQCGMDNGDKALENSIRFYGSYAGRGSIPYGDHPPSYATTANGKNGVAAVAFHLLGAKPVAQWFARLCASSNLKNFEGGHTGNYFNQTWSPLGVSISGDQNKINFWKRFHSYRDLARRRDGSFIAQPLPDTREGDLGSGNYVKYGPLWNTGGYALSYLAGSKRLAILGRRDSVFAANAPSELKPALDQFKAKNYKEAMETANKLKSSSDTRVAQLAAQLEGVAKRNLESIDLTLSDMKAKLEEGDLFQLKYQLLGIEGVLDASDGRLEEFREAIENSNAESIIKNGSEYHKEFNKPGWGGEKGFNFMDYDVAQKSGSRSKLKNISKKKVNPYAKLSEGLLLSHSFQAIKAEKSIVIFKLEKLGKKSHQASQEFKVENLESIGHLFLNFNQVKALKVILNGTLVFDSEMARPVTKETTVLMKPNTIELLKTGKNTISIEVSASGDPCEVHLKTTK